MLHSMLCSPVMRFASHSLLSEDCNIQVTPRPYCSMMLMTLADV